MSVPFVQLAPLAAESVLNAIPGGLLIAAVAWLLLRVIGGQNSGTRFAVWFCALLAVAAMPFMPSVSRAANGTHAAQSEIVLPGSWAVAIQAAWMLIAGVALTRIAAGLWKLRRLRSHSLPVALSSLPASIQAVVAEFQSVRRVTVCNSSAVSVPTAIGFFRPAILLPVWALQELSAEELKVILLHEFAHLRRWDDWTNLAQKLVRTVFFFHPAVWWIERRLSLEREMACDEAVLAETENPHAYAECLVSLAEKSFVRRGLALAQAVVGRARETSLRLARILDGNRPRTSRVFKPALGLATILAACGVIALPNAPRLVAFEDAAPKPATPAVSVAEVALPVPAAVIIPATLRTSAPALKAVAARKTLPATRVLRASKRDEVQLLAQEAFAAHPVRASAPQEMRTRQFVFVMETARYDEYGSAIVMRSVWRVSIDSENRRMVQQDVIVSKL